MEFKSLEETNLVNDQVVLVDPESLPDTPMVEANIKPPVPTDSVSISMGDKNNSWMKANKDLLVVGGIMLVLILLSSLKSKI